MMASDSMVRQMIYLKYGCNNFDGDHSMPLGFWKTEDIWNYISTKNLPYSKIYDMGEERTGCMFCMFGIHLEGDNNRFTRMKKSHPKIYNYCINELGIGEVLDYLGVCYKYTQRTFEL